MSNHDCAATDIQGIYRRTDGRLVVRIAICHPASGRPVERTKLLPSEATIEDAMVAKTIMRERLLAELEHGHQPITCLAYATGQPKRARPRRGDIVWVLDRSRRVPSGCWEWTFALGADGYGITTGLDGGPARAHRVAWEVLVGPITEGMFVLHLCDNRKCVNPAHLYVGNHAENMDDLRVRCASSRRRVRDRA